jgi:hypothetical protein
LPGRFDLENEWSLISTQVQRTFLARQMDRTNRNLILISLAMVLAVGAYVAVQWRYFYNFFKGPFEIDVNSLGQITNPETQLRYYVTIKGEDSVDTGLQDVERTESQTGVVQSETIKAEYAVLVLGKRLLIVKRNPKDDAKEYQGAITELPTDVHSHVVTPLLAEYPNADQVFLPLMLDATDFRSEGYISLVICFPVLLLAAWNFRKVIRRQNDPLLHPILKEESRYGQIADIAQRIDDELRGDTRKLCGAVVTTSWVLVKHMFSLDVFHIPDVIWAYKKVTKHSVNFIPTGKIFATIMFDRYGKSLEMDEGRSASNTFLMVLQEKMPWVVFGYSDELKKIAQEDWGGFVAVVDARRAGA